MLGEKTKKILIPLGCMLGWIPFFGTEMIFPLLIIITKDVNKVRKWVLVYTVIFGGINGLGLISFALSLFSKILCVYILFCTLVFIPILYCKFGIFGRAWLCIYASYPNSKKKFLIEYIKVKFKAYLKYFSLFLVGLGVIAAFLLFTGFGHRLSENESFMKIDETVKSGLNLLENSNEKSGGFPILLVLVAFGGLIFEIVFSVLIPMLWAYYLCLIGKRINHALGEKTTI